MCPRCDGSAEGCDRCGGTGREAITRCPNVTIPHEIKETVKLAIISEEGPWPEPGGSLDQSAWFMEARAVVFEVFAEWRKLPASPQSG